MYHVSFLICIYGRGHSYWWFTRSYTTCMWSGWKNEKLLSVQCSPVQQQPTTPIIIIQLNPFNKPVLDWMFSFSARVSSEWTCSPYSSQTCCSQLEPHPACSNCPQRHPGVPHSSGAGAMEGGAGGSVWWSGKHRTGSYCEQSNEFNSYYAS